jgi:hypothetical protein
VDTILFMLIVMRYWHGKLTGVCVWGYKCICPSLWVKISVLTVQISLYLKFWKKLGTTCNIYVKYIIQTSRSKWQPYNISVPLDLKVTKDTRLILNIIYVWKLNQTVLELDFWAVKFLFFPRRDFNTHYWYTAAPFAWPYVQHPSPLDHIHSLLKGASIIVVLPFLVRQI